MNLIFKPKLSKELILQRLSEESIMEHYLGIHVGKGLVCSPFRNDKHPTCGFFRNSVGDLFFKDFSGDFCGNCFNVVMRKYNCSYHKALQIIANDFGIVENSNLTRHETLINYSGKKFEKLKSSDIRVTIQDFTKEELEYWSSYGITEKTLKKFNVFSCKYLFLNGELFQTSNKKNFIFGYYYGIGEDNRELWRIYFPKQRDFRFLSNWKHELIQGSKQLPDKGEFVVITKSMKDVMCLYELEIPAIAPNSETLFINNKQLEILKSKFKKIVVLYDQDKAGKYNMAKIRRKYPELIYLVIPKEYEAKDISDFYKKFGRDKTLELINKTKDFINGSIYNKETIRI